MLDSLNSFYKHNIKQPFRSFKQSIKQLWLWLPIIWKDRDWDHTYIYRILKFKIENTRKLNQRNMRHVGVDREIYNMWVCELLIDRLIKDDYFDSFGEIHDRKWGKSSFTTKYSEQHKGYELIFNRDNVITEEDKEQEKKEYRKYLLLSKRNRDNDRKYLFELLERRIDNWWD